MFHIFLHEREYRFFLKEITISSSMEEFSFMISIEGNTRKTDLFRVERLYNIIFNLTVISYYIIGN